MRPSPVLCKRVKTRIAFTPKTVGKGFYRGTGTGSMGAHTPTGGYLIDYRKVRHFVKPYMQNNELTPFVSAELYDGYRRNEDQRGNTFKLQYDGMQYLDWFKHMNSAAFDTALNYANETAKASETQASSSSSSTSLAQEEPLYMGQEDHISSRQQDPTGSSSREK